MSWFDDMTRKLGTALGKKAAKTAADKVLDDALDDLEKALLGDLAGEEDPEAAMRKRDQERLDKLRARREAEHKHRVEREARAHKELAELKKKLGKE